MKEIKCNKCNGTSFSRDEYDQRLRKCDYCGSLYLYNTDVRATFDENKFNRITDSALQYMLGDYLEEDHSHLSGTLSLTDWEMRIIDVVSDNGSLSYSRVKPDVRDMPPLQESILSKALKMIKRKRK